jgi:predicted ATP-dependent serine protease
VSEPEKIPHVCRRCRKSFDSRPGARCPVDQGGCGTWNTIVPLRDAMDLPMPASALQGLGPVELTATGFVPWDKCMGGIFIGGVYLIGAGPGTGKALALDTPIPTPDGWTTMGQLQPGDVLFSDTGETCRVLWATEVMRDRACYEVEFSDGSKIVADADHLWRTFAEEKTTGERIKRVSAPYGTVQTTQQIADSLKAGQNRAVVNNHPHNLELVVRRIVGAKPVASVPVRCISVDAPSKMFLAGKTMIPTHNSTMCLQILGLWHATDKLYISAEEPREAVAARGVRLGCPDGLCESGCSREVPIIGNKELGTICELISMAMPGTLVVIDSLQKINVSGERMGGVSALKIAVEEIKKARDRSGATILLISHVTKDDEFAGPKTVEHDVDACAMMAKISGQARVLRCDAKNRFAADGKTQWMRMTSEGLVDSSPDLILPPEKLPGRVLTITSEGMPAEVQAMASRRSGGLTIGLPDERARLACTLIYQEKNDFMIRADGDALERDPSADLAMILAVASEILGKPLAQRCCAWGQVTLDGRILPASNHDERAQAARDLELLPTFSADSVKTVEEALEAVGLLEGIERLREQQEEAEAEDRP